MCASALWHLCATEKVSDPWFGGRCSIDIYASGVTANEVDSAIAAPIHEVGVRLLAIREDQWFDRKSIRSEPKHLAPILVAMANAEGGVIVVGLANGVVEGVKAHAAKLNDLRQAAIDHTGRLCG